MMELRTGDKKDVDIRNYGVHNSIINQRTKENEMSKTKAAQIAEALNKYHAERPFDFRQVAGAAAEPSAEVWQMNARGKWMRRIGMVRLNGSIWVATSA